MRGRIKHHKSAEVPDFVRHQLPEFQLVHRANLSIGQRHVRLRAPHAGLERDDRAQILAFINGL